MRRRGLRGTLVALWLAATVAGAAPGGVSLGESRLLDRAVPDIPLRLADGGVARISELWRDRPLLVTFFSRRCTGICTPFLQWVREAVSDAGGLGRDYRVLVLSFDDADTVADLRAQAAVLGVAQERDWSFAVAQRSEVARLAGALDYRYRIDPATGQYDHDALLVAVDRGRVLRALLGSPRASERLRELVWELRGSFIPSYRVPGQTALRCLSFDPKTGETRLDWGSLLLVLPALTAVALALAVFTGATRSP